jgi:DNA adenine methylase
MHPIGHQLDLLNLASPDLYLPKPKPFLKWAGGKTQLLEQFAKFFPPALAAGEITTYIEPFIGSGALFFYLAEQFSIEKFVISDINPELILAYLTIQNAVEPLIAYLNELEQRYHALPYSEQEKFYYSTRSEFNRNRDNTNSAFPNVERTAQIIFLNRTCYNGLFRVNAKGGFNVPFGSYKNPPICFPRTLRDCSAVLQRTEIVHGDFSRCRPHVNANTFIYFDPPYKPISPTSSFKSYQADDFDDLAQMRLADYYKELHNLGAKLMLSNSDPQNINPTDTFFQDLYPNFSIKKVQASRMINSKGEKRGKITELLIMNYETE